MGKREDNLKPFKPGQSGNPNGRPKGSGVTDQLKKLLHEEIELKGKKTTMAEAIAKVCVSKALKGDHRFVKEILDRTEGKVKDQLSVDGEMRIVNQRFVVATKKAEDDDNDPD